MCHRLDKSTSGCIVFAKNKKAAKHFSKCLKNKDVKKTYSTILKGKIKKNITVDIPIYKINELSTNHGDPKRFSCEIYINGSKEAFCFGKSHKKAEKNAAGILIEKIFREDQTNALN